MITREQILPALRGALEELPFVEAAWLGGSESFGRNDQYSDLDLGATGDESRWEECFAHVERAMERVSPIIHKLIVPMPTWHGHPQRFYQLANTDEFMRVDFIYLLPRLKHIFLEPIRHGRPVVLFDRTNALQLVELDWKAHNAAMRARLGVLRETFALFYIQPKKSALRGDEIEAVNWYFAFVVRPLVEILRMKHCPARYDYGTRYTQIDLPAEIVARLRELHRVNGCKDVLAKTEAARAWFEQVAAELSGS